MTAKELAALLDGREYGVEITDDEAEKAKADGLVVVYGYSDDNVELCGAICEEIGAYDGTTFNLSLFGLGDHEIHAVWCGKDTEAAWTYKTDIPHETFNIYEDGELFCVGIVFSVEDL